MVTYFTLEDLISFGNYLLSKERRESFKHNPEFTNDELLEERLNQVHHSDIENWKNLQSIDQNKHLTVNDGNMQLSSGLSLIQAKDAAMIEGKKIRHHSFMDDEYIYYKNGCWFTQDGYQIPDAYWLIDQEQEWWNDGWSVVS